MNSYYSASIFVLDLFKFIKGTTCMKFPSHLIKVFKEEVQSDMEYKTEISMF